MAGLRIGGFSGMMPRKSSSLIADNEAQNASNTKLFSGELRSWRKPATLLPKVFVDADAQSIYLHKKPNGDARWLSWTTDVNVATGPIYALGEYPIYLTGHGSKPQKTNALLQDTATYRDMGLPVPTAKLSVGVLGGAGTAESRVYLFTYISLFGTIEEESAASPPSNIATVPPGAVVTLTGIPAAPAGALNITKMRIYRQVTGTSSNPYLKVADCAPGTASFVDSVTALNLGQILSSSAYYPPPDDLKGITPMANGIAAGFRGNEIYFSEPYKWHAWPPQNALTVEFPVVGIAAFGQSLVVGTSANPFVITGSTPAAMTQTKLPLLEPCVSKRSVASDEIGVMYASPNGIIKISQGFAGNITKPLFTRDEWQIYHPESMVGAVLDSSYYLFYQNALLSVKEGLIFNRDEQASAFTATTISASAVYIEPTTANLYLANESQIRQWHGDPINFLPYEWKSKLFVLPQPVNFGAGQIDADFSSAQAVNDFVARANQVRAANVALFGSGVDLQAAVNSAPVHARVLGGSIMAYEPEVDALFVLLKVFCNGRQVSSQFVRSRSPFRLPSGFKGDRWEFQLSGTIPVRTLKIASTSKELVQL